MTVRTIEITIQLPMANNKAIIAYAMMALR